jgi:copper chaperone CopZ
MGVKKALANVPGLTTLDVKIGEATVEGPLDAAKTAIEGAGYDVVGTK